MQEYDIDTMQALNERRGQAQRDGDQQMVFFIESLMLQKCLAEKWDPQERSENESLHVKHEENKKILETIATHWTKRWHPNEYQEHIRNAVYKGLDVDNVEMLHTLLNAEMFKPQQNWRNEMLSEFLTYAAGKGAVECLVLLLDNGTEQAYEAPALTAAIKTRNQPLVDIIIDSMVRQGSAFVCGALFPQVIKYNMVLAAQAIIEHRWHKPTQRDLEIASSVDNDVFKYLAQRQNAAIDLHDDGDLNLDDWEETADGDDDDWEGGW